MSSQDLLVQGEQPGMNMIMALKLLTLDLNLNLELKLVAPLLVL